MPQLMWTGTRPSAIAGQWYPADPDRLRQTIRAHLDAVQASALAGEIVGLIVPHAGYAYSGPVAAHAYRLIEGQAFDCVVILSPLHRFAPGQAAITAVASYHTPLGDVPLAQDLIGALADRIRLTFLRGEEEHSLEIQLPFLQVALERFHLVPIMLADQSWDYCRELGTVLAGALRESGQRALIVASTDLSHFHSHEIAHSLDQIALDAIAAYDLAGLARALARGDTEACGGGPVLAAMVAARQLGADSAKVLHYADSGDVTGDYRRVVGYAAGVLTRPAVATPPATSP